MKNRGFLGCLALLVAVVAISGCFGRKKEEKPFRADSKDLKHTIITAHLEQKIVPGKNLIYCSTFQLAWNELRDNIVKEDVRLTDEPPMVKILNKKLTTKADISEDCYVAMAGFGKDNILAKINQALRSKFDENAPTVTAQLPPESIFAYTFLFKDLKFPTPFESLKKPVSFRSPSGIVPVKAFGIREFAPRKPRHAKLGRQVRILAYDYSTDECVITLISSSPGDQIILARINPRQTLMETIRSVLRMVEGRDSQSLDYNDALQMPKLDFDIFHSYSELLGKDLLNEGFTTYYIAKARQDIRFRLNEKGAMLKSQAEIQVESASMNNLVFDSPFLLYLKEKQSKYPYLAVWVDNPEILLKY
ncbi:hypothetical protein HQ563_18765 [bacterium]|nr:hypothetical protein [bacterium]